MGDLEKTAPLGTRENDGVSLLSIFAVLAQRRKVIVLSTIVVSGIVLLCVFVTKILPPTSGLNFLPDYYDPKVLVLLAEKSNSSGLGALFGADAQNVNQLGGLSALGGASGGTIADLAIALLGTNVIEDQISSEFDFQGRYGLIQNVKTASRNKVAEALQVKYNPKSKILEISYRDIDPEFSTHVVNRIVELLEDRFQSLTLEKVLRKKAYFEENIPAFEADTENAEAELLAFQSKYGIVDLGSQAAENIRMTAELRSQQLGKELEVKTLREYLKENDPQVVRLKNEINKISQLIGELKGGFKEFSAVNIPQKDLPELSVEYLNLRRELESRYTILALLKQQYQMNKIEELDTSGSFQIIEAAEIPEVKSGPSRSKIVVIGTVAAFFIGVLVAFIQEYIDRMRHDPVESEKLLAIRAMMPLGKRRSGS